MSNESPSQSSLALPSATDADTQAPSTNEPSRSAFALSEDWIAVLLGGGILMLCLAAVLIQGNGEEGWSSPLTPFLAKSGTWNWPFEAFTSAAFSSWIGIFGAAVFSLVTFAIATRLTGMSVKRFVPGFLCIFTLATIAYACSTQVAVKSLNLEYALWALAIGLIISNTTGTPAWVRPAVRTELYIKTGLVLLGASVLFSKLLVLGLPGVCIAWIVTPIVLISTFWFGQKVLKIDSASLNMVISADMSVCGVSAAVATSAACKAKKEELSLAIGLSLMFTVVMMVVMPAVIQGLALNPILGGAWMGGTIDATGAVVAAGTALGDEGATVAATV
ncbi:MAG: putative sulfate exporter family transporter, partial [Planctomycetota bacterium]|nr:putative sulfate exporter family transporter [Planctomycetota bacterium]